MRCSLTAWVFFGLALSVPNPCVAGAALARQQQPPQSQTKAVAGEGIRNLRVFIEGDTSEIPKFIKVSQEMAAERKLAFDFTRDKDSGYDVRVVLSAEGSSAWSYAHGNIVVMDSKSNVMFTVTRSDRWTAKGTTNAMTKEFVKMLSRYYGLTK